MVAYITTAVAAAAVVDDDAADDDATAPVTAACAPAGMLGGGCCHVIFHLHPGLLRLPKSLHWLPEQDTARGSSCSTLSCLHN